MGNPEKKYMNDPVAELAACAKRLDRRQTRLEVRRRSLDTLVALYEALGSDDLRVGIPKEYEKTKAFPAQTLTYFYFASDRHKRGHINRFRDEPRVHLHFDRYDPLLLQRGDPLAMTGAGHYKVDILAAKHDEPQVVIWEFAPTRTRDGLRLRLPYSALDDLAQLIESTPPSFNPDEPLTATPVPELQ